MTNLKEKESDNIAFYKERVKNYQTLLDEGKVRGLSYDFIKVVYIQKDTYNETSDEYYANFGLLESGSSRILPLYGFYNELHSPISLKCPHYFENHNISYLGDFLEKCYIRLGDIPKDELSLNHSTKTFEKGVSVFRGVVYKDNYLPIVEYPEKAGTILPMQGMFYHWDKPVYIVKGNEIGLGSDGEPLIKNVHIIKRIFPEIYYITTKEKGSC